ncbi:uncharacterized protein [Antedon mediterranea]|uniref:uncharacterized protein n=1 Tax=Antedon mediterranea TaxID=105859 RepID=UPI003AF78C6D
MASKAGRNAGIQSLSSSMRPAAASTVCYVCGAQSAECRLRVRPHGKESFFPFLEYHEAPSGVSINKDGTVDACRVCYAFLLQQWYAFEKSRTPIVKRLYWLKRLESCGSPGTNRPDPQMQVSPQMREEMYKLNIRDPAFVDDHFDSPDLLAKTEFIEKKHDDFDAPIDLPKFSVCYCCSQMTSRNAVCVVHTSHWSKSESPYFPCILGHTPPSGARSVDNLGRVLMCEPCANYLLQQWQTFEINNTPLHKRKYRLQSTQEKLFVESTSKMVCLTCGVKSNVNNMQLVHSHANLNKGPFFPCLERCIAPKGASLSRDGVAQLCNSCAASLYEQWNAHEVTQTPLKNRIYHINNKPVGYTHKLQLKSRKLHQDLEEATTEVCYICSKSVKSSLVHSVNTSAEEEHTMFFPFIRDLERPSKAMAIDSSGKVHVCDDCFNHLKTKWKKSDRNGFDKGFKPIVQENGNIETASCSQMAAVGDIVDTGTCFICGSNESPSELNDLHCYPSNEEEGIPFFPFLSNPKASHNSEIVTTSGVVKACTFCYVNMVIQWDDYENSESLMDHNRWLRPYHMRKFTCFTCSQAADISCRKLLDITKFNGLARLRKPFGAIFIEDGQIVVVCKPCEKSLHKQKKDLMLMGVPESEQLFNVDNKEVKEQVNQLKPSVNENSKIKEKGESVIVIDSDSDSEKDLAARRSHAHLQASVPQSVIQARPSQRPASVGRPVSVGLPTSGTRPGSAGRPQSSGKKLFSLF